MPRDDTPAKAKDLFGDSLYQRRARAALPILVRQAAAQQKINYENLAEELSMRARNLNYVLGSVGTTLLGLGRKWDDEIPAIQCLVVNKATGLPGEGVDSFLLRGRTMGKLNRKQKHALVNAVLGNVFSYPKWPRVLKALKLMPVESSARLLVQAARTGRGAGESEEHRWLKNYIAGNSDSVGLSKAFARGKTEFALPSGDCVDVVFSSELAWIAVEVKSLISDEGDITRGLFQCVKYRAVIDAWRGSEGEAVECRAILALGKKFPDVLIPLRNVLGVEVVENVGVRKMANLKMRVERARRSIGNR